jgi:nicotinate-nucleotide adenylyltransferase
MTARLGIFGGTFNPIHLGHLRAAEEVAEALGIARVLFVPSSLPPHKTDDPDDPIAPAEARLAWVRAAIAGNSRFEVDSLEIDRAGPSYSVDTVREVCARITPEPPVFIIGQDAFVEVSDWREPEALFELAHFAVITRPPAGAGSLVDWLPKCVRDDVEIAEDGLSGRHRSGSTWVRIVEITALDISASEIRARLRAGRSVRYLLPESVAGLVEQSGVYGERR